MTPEKLAQLHQLCFTTPRPWGVGEFTDLLSSKAVLLITVPEGFALGRIAGPEVELLTLAVHPDARRAGIGRKLVAEFEIRARQAGASEAFLEVSEGNMAALGLYQKAGYCKAGYRKDYYAGANSKKSAAIVMRRKLGST